MLGNPSTILMQAQGNAVPFYTASGTTYTPDANGYIQAAAKDVSALLLGGFALVPAPWANFKNILDGGDFSVNPWQRNIAALATANKLTTPFTNTPTYFPDRWFGVAGASGSGNMTKSAQTDVIGFSVACKLQRTSGNTDVNPISMGQVCETADSIRLQNRKVTLSFWAKAGANFSAAGGTLRARIFSGTGTDDTAANMIAGSWSGSTTPVDDSTTVLTTTAQRFQLTGLIPAGATQVGVLFSFTPVGTAGADDSISFYGIQLEDGPQATPFEHRDVQVELEICQRYCWVTAEPGAGVVVGMGSMQTTQTAVIYMATPVQMRAAPTLTVTTGSFNFRPANAAASGTASAGATHTPNAITVNGASITASTAGFATPLLGGGGSGAVVASADY